MATQKKTKTAKAQVKVKDLKPAKNAKGGTISWGSGSGAGKPLLPAV